MRLAFAATLIVLTLGCDQPQPVSETRPVDEVRMIEVSSDAFRMEEPSSEAASSETVSSDVANSDVVSSDLASSDVVSSDVVSSDVAEPASSEPASPGAVEDDSLIASAAAGQRLLLPTSAGFLLVDVEIRIGELSLAEHYEQRLESLQRDARGAADELSWQQLVQFVADHPRRFGTAVQQNAGMAENYDTNKNQLVDRDELEKFLFRGMNKSGPMPLSSHDRFRQVNRRDSPLFMACDANADQRLDADEQAQSVAGLQRLDRNFDARLDEGEAAAQQVNESMSPSARSSANGASVLGPNQQWGALAYTLDAMQDRSPWQMRNVVQAIDDDSNGGITRDEAKQLASVAAHLRLRLQFSADQSQPATLQLVFSDPSMKATARATTSRLSLSDESLSLSFEVSDVASQRESIPPEAFAMLDANADQRLSKEELPPEASSTISFETFDADQDGGLTIAEINAGLRGEDPLWLSQVHVEAAEVEDAWFDWLDVDSDRSLSTRELETSAARVQLLDRDADGVLRWSDVPDAYRVVFVRRDAEDARPMSTAAGAQPSRLPNWAAQMDRNGDGELSRQEFLGSQEQFRDLDRNEDGFITAEEVGQASSLSSIIKSSIIGQAGSLSYINSNSLAA